MEPQPEVEYAEWVKQQEEVVRELGQALQSADIKEQQLAVIVERAAQHYQHYFRATRAASHRIYTLLASTSMSPLERAFMWLGGMRPSLSFQLIYAITGHQIQAELEELLELGTEAGEEQLWASLASLSASQLAELSELQTFTMQEEDKVEREMAKLQQSAADRSLVLGILGSAGASSPASTSASASGDNTSSSCKDSMDSAISKKLDSLEEICMQANSLRLSTFSRVLDLLHAPFQKAQYLLAAAKLQVALRNVGHAKAPPLARLPY